jgi:hypothetical protein
MGAPIPNQFAGNQYSAISAALSALRGPISHLRYLSAPLANALVRTFTRRRSIANTMASDILIVDDEPDIRELVAGILQEGVMDSSSPLRPRASLLRNATWLISAS